MDDWIMLVVIVRYEDFHLRLRFSIADRSMQALVVVLTVFSALRKNSLLKDIIELRLTSHRSVASYGLGRDIWTIPFDNITQVLYVCSL
jgi:hypothetical protein